MLPPGATEGGEKGQVLGPGGLHPRLTADTRQVTPAC